MAGHDVTIVIEQQAARANLGYSTIVFSYK